MKKAGPLYFARLRSQGAKVSTTHSLLAAIADGRISTTTDVVFQYRPAAAKALDSLKELQQRKLVDVLDGELELTDDGRVVLEKLRAR